MRPLAPPDDPDPAGWTDAVCAGLPAVGASCVACADGEVACLAWRVEDLTGHELVGAALTDAFDPTCAP